MGGANLRYLALLGIVQMGLGLFFLSLGARLIPAAEAALITQLENVLGPLWVWLAGIERPPAATIVGRCHRHLRRRLPGHPAVAAVTQPPGR